MRRRAYYAKNKISAVLYGALMVHNHGLWYGVYNVAIKQGYHTMAGSFSNMTNHVFLEALIEVLYMWILVFIFSNLWGKQSWTQARRKNRSS